MIKKGKTGRFVTVHLLTIMALLLSYMVFADPNRSSASGIRLDKKEVSLTDGETVTLQLKGAKKKVTWSSSDPSVATVTSKGANHAKATVKAVSGGAAVITAKCNRKKYSCKVTVSIIPATHEYTQISQAEAMQMMARNDGHVIVDVRREDEYAEGHIPGAILIPNETIGTEKPEQLPDLDQIILVYCRSGNRSKEASQKLVDIGYTHVYEFGGIITWPGAITT